MKIIKINENESIFEYQIFSTMIMWYKIVNNIAMDWGYYIKKDYDFTGIIDKTDLRYINCTDIKLSKKLRYKLKYTYRYDCIKNDKDLKYYNSSKGGKSSKHSIKSSKARNKYKQ